MEEKTFTTPHGNQVRLYCRPGTNDADMARSALENDEYNLKDIAVNSIKRAVDIGAHTGMVAIGLAVDHPNVRVIAVEPVPENAEIMRANIDANNVADRVTVMLGAAAKSKSSPVKIAWNFSGNDSADVHRFIGNQRMDPGTIASSFDAEPVTIEDITADGVVDLLVIDAEGAEYEILGASGRTATLAKKKIKEIRGEFHFGFQKLHDLIASTHTVVNNSDDEAFGGFTARLSQ